MAEKKAAAAAKAESGLHEYRFVGPMPHVFPDLARTLTPGEGFESHLEIHHVYVEIKAGGKWVDTYQPDPEILQGPEPELVEEA